MDDVLTQLKERAIEKKLGFEDALALYRRGMGDALCPHGRRLGYKGGL